MWWTVVRETGHRHLLTRAGEAHLIRIAAQVMGNAAALEYDDLETAPLKMDCTGDAIRPTPHNDYIDGPGGHRP